MSYEWYNQIDRLARYAESKIDDCVRSDYPDMLGAAPSAMDAIRSHLRAQAASRSPNALLEQCESLNESDVLSQLDRLAKEATASAHDRSAEHVSRADVQAVFSTLNYPFT